MAIRYCRIFVHCIDCNSYDGRIPQNKKNDRRSHKSESNLVDDEGSLCIGILMAAFLYVSVECAIYVWMPTILRVITAVQCLLPPYALSIFYSPCRRAFPWSMVNGTLQLGFGIEYLQLLIFLCFLGSVIGGISFAVVLLPLSGLFMSVIYPTINSKGISCFPKTKHKGQWQV